MGHRDLTFLILRRGFLKLLIALRLKEKEVEKERGKKDSEVGFSLSSQHSNSIEEDSARQFKLLIAPRVKREREREKE